MESEAGEGRGGEGRGGEGRGGEGRGGEGRGGEGRVGEGRGGGIYEQGAYCIRKTGRIGGGEGGKGGDPQGTCPKYREVTGEIVLDWRFSDSKKRRILFHLLKKNEKISQYIFIKTATNHFKKLRENDMMGRHNSEKNYVEFEC